VSYGYEHREYVILDDKLNFTHLAFAIASLNLPELNKHSLLKYGPDPADIMNAMWVLKTLLIGLSTLQSRLCEVSAILHKPDRKGIEDVTFEGTGYTYCI
jgi:hypothetical protein